MKQKNIKGSILKSLKAFFTTNIFLKVISLVFAVLFWGYVMLDQNPSRTKVVSNVAVSIDGEADLLARNLIVSNDDKDTLLAPVTVRVSTVISKYANLTSDQITATISLKNVNQAGSYELQINANTTQGTVVDVNPSSIVIDIDNLVTRRIPVTVETVGALPDGYWSEGPVLGRTEIEIEGPYSVLENITSAVCSVDLSTITRSFNHSESVTLMSSDGTEADVSALIGSLPSVSVGMTVYHTKEVEIDLGSAIVGTDALSQFFELSILKCTPATVLIAGTEEQLATVDKLTIEQLDVTGSNKSVTSRLAIIAPSWMRFVDLTQQSVLVTAIITESTNSIVFDEMSVMLRGLPSGLNSSKPDAAVSVTFTGRASLISAIQRNDVEVYLDLSTYSEPGTYEVPIRVGILDDTFDELQFETDIGTVSVVIR